MGCLALTYFRERKLTIIGATLFHGPVRDGKGWDQRAMDARRNLYAAGEAAKEEEGVVIVMSCCSATRL